MSANTNKGPKMNIPMCIAAVLFCLVLFTTHLTGGLLARYTASGSANDNARVAKFRVTENYTTFSDSLVMGVSPGTIERTIEVKNDSEVVVAYTITITNVTDNIPYVFSVNDETGTQTQYVHTSYLEPNTKQDIKIVATWAQEGALEYMGMVDLIKIQIDAQQVD